MKKLIALLVVAALGVGGYFLYTNNKDVNKKVNKRIAKGKKLMAELSEELSLLAK